MDWSAAKDASVVAVVDALAANLGSDAFVVVDHWPDDAFAIGVAAPDNHGVLAYVSASPGADEPFFVCLELPPDGEWADYLYTPGDDRNVCGMEELIAMVAQHIRHTPPNKSLERSRDR